jgi:spoIIIJ-associated protein
MRHVETTAPTIEEATEKALVELGVSRDRVNVEILSEGQVGMFGLGREDARVRVTILESDADNRIKVAREILADLLSRLDLPAEVNAEAGIVADEEEQVQPVVLDINGDELGILIGRRGQTLAALQYILRLMVTQKLAISVPLVLDVNGYKKRRYDSLRTLAKHVAEQVAVSQRSFALEPMPAYERRIIHMTLAEHPVVTTQSVGFGEARKVTVVPKGKQFSR